MNSFILFIMMLLSIFPNLILLVGDVAPRKYWIDYGLKRIINNKNFLMMMLGPTGSGKSWASISIAQQFDPEFTADRIVFDGLQLMELINSGKLHPGSAIVWEEVGTSINNKKWASMANIMINYLIQTFRNAGLILIINTPYPDFIDSGIRKLFHAEINTLRIDKNTRECVTKPVLLQYNSRLAKFYYKRLRVSTPDGAVPISTWRISAPSQDLIDVYEKKKLAFTKGLNIKIEEALREAYTPKFSAKKLTDTQQEILDDLNAGMKVKDIATKRNIRVDSTYGHIVAIKKKGFLIEKYKEEDKPEVDDSEMI